MANTIVTGKNGIDIVFDGSTAWDSTTLYPSGLVVNSIQYVPVATDDILTVREDGSATGRRIMKELATDAYDNRIKYFNTEGSYRKHKLYVKGNEITASNILMIEFK